MLKLRKLSTFGYFSSLMAALELEFLCFSELDIDFFKLKIIEKYVDDDW